MERYWRIIHDPSLATIDDVVSIFCHKVEFTGRVGARPADADRWCRCLVFFYRMSRGRYGATLHMEEEIAASLPDGIDLDTDHREVCAPCVYYYVCSNNTCLSPEIIRRAEELRLELRAQSRHAAHSSEVPQMWDVSTEPRTLAPVP